MRIARDRSYGQNPVGMIKNITPLPSQPRRIARFILPHLSQWQTTRRFLISSSILYGKIRRSPTLHPRILLLLMRTCPPWVQPQLENGIETQETSMDIQIEMEARSLSDLSRQGGGPNQVRVHLGVQEQHTPKMMPRPHTESILDVLYMDGKIISRSFQWNYFQA